MKIEIAACERPPPELRERYFAALPEPQVHYLEQRVAAARLLRLGPADAPLGYMAIHDGAVVEFHAEPALLPQLSEAFYAAAALGGAGSAIVKSYDALALAAATGAGQDRRRQLHRLDRRAVRAAARLHSAPGGRRRPGLPSRARARALRAP